MAEVAELDPATRTAIATDGERRTGDALVVAAGSKPNFFHTAGADEHAFPLYSLPDAERLRSRIIGAFEAADRNPALIDRRASRDPRRRVDDPHALRRLGRRDHGPAGRGRRRPPARARRPDRGRSGPDGRRRGGVYAVGGVANIPGPDGRVPPQLGSVALQSGVWAAENILAGLDGRPRRPFRYRDKGIMAMIGRGAALAEIGPRRRELHGLPAFGAWLGVHGVLMTGVRNRIETLMDWSWDYLAHNRGPQVLDRAATAEIDWGDDRAPAASGDAAAQQTTPA
jgi:NADH dehydrogenase FAD-containing subunit